MEVLEEETEAGEFPYQGQNRASTHNVCVHDGCGTCPGGAEEWRGAGIIIKQVALRWRSRATFKGRWSQKGSLALPETCNCYRKTISMQYLSGCRTSFKGKGKKGNKIEKRKIETEKKEGGKE